MALARPIPRSRTARFNEIVQTLIRNDVWGLIRSVQKGDPTARNGHAPAPERMRIILEELGPTFIKLGQLLATRPDLVSEPYVEELKKLYDKTTPSPQEEVERTIETELGRPISELFASFDQTPIASASIGQVHRAKLHDGTPVAVKVQHVGIEQSMRLDFEILHGLLKFMERTFAATRVWQPLEHLEELRVMLERELDYLFEMKNTERVRQLFKNDESVLIPKMHKKYCSPRVLVMDFVEGIRFSDVDSPAMEGVDRKNVAKVVTHAMARQIFIHRIFHADPSPGNMLIIDSSKVAFLDFGAVGVVTERRAKSILKLMSSINKGDLEGAVDAIVDLCEQKGEYDAKAFAADVEKVLDFVEREDASVADPHLMEMMLNLAKKHRMLLPSDFILINRALFQFEGFCRELDPDYDLVAVLDPLIGEVLWKSIANPKKQKELVEDTVGEMLRFLRTLPHTLNYLVRKVERNELSMRLDIAGMEGYKSAQGRGVLKMSFTIMMAALVIGLGILYAGPAGDTEVRQFLFGAAAITIIWTIVMVLWSEAFKGRRE